MATIRNEPDRRLSLAIALSTAVVFLADLVVPLGVSMWVLYFAPIALSALSWRPRTPLVTVAVCSVLIALGYLIKVDYVTAAARFSPVNRSFALVTFWAVALLCRRFIVSRLTMQREDWLKAAQAGLSTRMEGELTYGELGTKVLEFLAATLGAQVGVLYVIERDGSFRRVGAYALDPAPAGSEVVLPGQGLVGQAAREKRVVVIDDVPEKYLDVRSALGGHPPRQLVIAPAHVDGRVQAVIELGFLTPLEAADLEVFPRVSASLASAVRSTDYRVRQAELLGETQRQAEELQSQQEELRVQNEELEQQTAAQQAAQLQLENQQAELEQINSQLEEQTQTLERQRDDLAHARREAERTSRYKSEFLANMSHELRTPLNSSLILAKLLMDNRDGNLNGEQIQFAQTIYSAGNDLLTLINDILDLSRIEAGRLEVQADAVPIAGMVDDLLATFQPVAEEKQLELTATVDEDVGATIESNPTRLEQILKNLLSNALKFTEGGGVSLHVRCAGEERVAFEVRDTGIGIAADQQEVIFEAFRQADGTTNRKYGGTGLGLSISRDLARLLGGELTVDSAPGRGSTFTLLLPKRYEAREPAGGSGVRGQTSGLSPNQPADARTAPRAPARPRPAPATPPAAAFDDDRELVGAGSRSILVIEDDPSFARIVHDLAHELDFQALVAANGEEGLEMAARYRPSAIVLDIGLPDRSGLSVLDALKHDPATRHIPVHVVSASDHTHAALQMGAAGYAVKPVEREELVGALRRLEEKFTQKLRHVLVVEDDATARDSICRLLAGDEVVTVAVGTASEALEQLAATTFDCMVLDLTLPDRPGLDLLREMSRGEHAFPPVIVYTGRSLSADEEQDLRRFSSAIIIKGARSPERLLDEVTLFLHQVESDLPPERQSMLRTARHREAVFEGRRVLVVEDDVRNIFALSSVLEPRGAKVEIARNGREALAHLAEKPGVDLVLMDIMMPEMDGLEAMRRIREQPGLAKLPIIALTAKAMADDRESCLAAGANDYIAKPLDVDKLLSLARVWMPK